MSKQNKKLIAEIQNGLKQVDEGIAQLEMLEVKVENASTISIKEKYRQDMKREIKRLQRLRDIFRQNVNNPAIVEQHRLVEARKRIETEMEKFRDHEKEYKSKRPTKAAMLVDAEVKGKFNYGSGSSFDGEYGDEGNEMGEDDDDDLNDDSDSPQDINLDKQWLASFVSDTLRTIMSKYDSELDKIQNKKTKGGQKKNRDKINALKAKKSHFQHIKDRAEELQISMDYLEPGKIRQLKIQSKQLNQNADEEAVRVSVLHEIDSLIELSEQNRRSLQNNNANESQLASGAGANTEAGRVAREIRNVEGSEDVVVENRILSSLRIGNILDAQDYLGTWHLSIVIDDGTTATNDQPSDQRTLHFLPFMKANRDEVFSAEDQTRLSPAFSKQEAQGEPQQQLATLQTYLENHLRKTGQNPATIQQNKQLRQQQLQQQQMAAKEESKGATSASASSQAAAISSQNSQRHKRTDSHSNNNNSHQLHQQQQSKQHLQSQNTTNNLMQQQQMMQQNAPGTNGSNQGLMMMGNQSNMNGSGLQLQKGGNKPHQQPKAPPHSQQQPQQQVALGAGTTTKSGGQHSLQQQEIGADQARSNKNTTSRMNNNQPLSGSSQGGLLQQQQDERMGGSAASLNVQLTGQFEGGDGNKGDEKGFVGGMLPGGHQQLFRDMPAFGSGQFLGSTSGDGAFKAGGLGGQDIQLNASGLKDGSQTHSSVLLQNPNSGLSVGGSLGAGGVTQTQQPPMMKDTSLSERKHNLDLLETSFKNILTMQDQEVTDDSKEPLSVWEEHDYPRVPLFNRKENFSKFDLETLFFAFYYQQNTYQQYLAAVELKKKNWKFVKKFETWFKKDESDPSTSTSTNAASASQQSNSQADGGGNNMLTTATSTMSAGTASATSIAPPSEQQQQVDQSSSATSNAAAATAAASSATNSGATSSAAASAPQKDVGRYVFFDYENGWQQLVRDDFELDLSQIENELVVQPVVGSSQTSGGGLTANSTLGLTSAPPQQQQATGASLSATSQATNASGSGTGNAPSTSASRSSTHAMQ